MSNEHYGFVFSISFILIFSALLISTPVDLQGLDETPSELLPVDPSLVSGFSDDISYNGSDFSLVVTTEIYDYELNSLDWRASYVTTGQYFSIGTKVTWFTLWFGQINYVGFRSDSETDRGTTLTLPEINADSDEGVSRYTGTFQDTGNSAGTFIFYWNSTLHSSASNAWGNDSLTIIHGVGINEAAGLDIVSLLLSLLFLQLPDCPLLINIILATPVWACVIYLIWWFIISMIPFLGGG